MKRNIILVMAVSLMTTGVNAQLKVDANGRVGIKADTDESYTLRTHSTSSTTTGTLSVTRIPTSAASDPTRPWSVGTFSRATHNNSYNLYSFGIRAQATSETNINYSGVGRCFGVFAQAFGGTDGYNYGLYGCIGQRPGAAVYGTTNDYLGIALDQRYAGYFNGNVKIQGNLTVTGNINGVVVGRSSGSSDSRDVSTTQRLLPATPVSSQLSDLDINTFYHNQPVINRTIASSSDTSEVEIPLTDMEKQVLSKQHYGLDAEQLEEIFPDLVYEDEDGSKSINYMEMVPLLIQSIKELKAEINELKGTGVRKVQQTSAVESLIETTDAPALGQNVPNPFSTSTVIQVNIPKSVHNAAICLYDLQGKKVKQMDITVRGKQTIQINASELEEGMYLYSLIVDGKVIQTWRMIVEK